MLVDTLGVVLIASPWILDWVWRRCGVQVCRVWRIRRLVCLGWMEGACLKINPHTIISTFGVCFIGLSAEKSTCGSLGMPRTNAAPIHTDAQTDRLCCLDQNCKT